MSISLSIWIWGYGRVAAASLLQRLQVKLGRLLAGHGIFKRSNEDALQSQQRHTSLQPCTDGEFLCSVIAPCCKPEKHVINSCAVLQHCLSRSQRCMHGRAPLFGLDLTGYYWVIAELWPVVENWRHVHKFSRIWFLLSS
jgi:hypothetical protein